MNDGPHAAQPPADPWADSGHTFSYVRPGSTDELPDVTPPPTGVGRGWIYLVLGVVVALVASGSALVGASVWFGWGGTQIEEIMPGTTAAFVRVDLSPGLGQQLKFADLAKKFPERAGDGDRFKQSLLSDYDLEPLSYDTDIKPWFGDQLGAGVWSKDGAYYTSCTLVVLASRDDTAAAAALAKVRDTKGSDEFGFALTGGYAVFSHCEGGADSQSNVDAALTEGRTASLAHRPGFADGLAALPSGQMAVGFADLSSKLLPRFLGDDLRVSSPNGELVVGAQVTGDGVDLRFRLRGGVQTTDAADVVDRLGQLPDSVAIAAAADLSGFGDGLSSLVTGTAPLRQLADGLDAGLGSVVNIALSRAGDDPQAKVSATAANADRAGDITYYLESSGGPLSGVKVTTEGRGVEGVTDGYRATGGRLADLPLYRAALDGASDAAAIAIYADVQKVATDVGEAGNENVKPVRAIGFTVGNDKGTLAGLLRIII